MTRSEPTESDEPATDVAGVDETELDGSGVDETEADVAGVEELAAEFATHRQILIGAAYRVVGSVTDAEDVVQETWLRWAAADRSEVRDTRAYLIRIATRLALNRLRQQQARREQYVGP